MLPEKGTKCHRTFSNPSGPIDCRVLVCDHGCKLWQRVAEIIDRDPETGEAIAKDKFDCVDSLQGMFWKDMLRRQLQTTAHVNKLAEEVKAANDSGMAHTLMGLNRQIQHMAERDVAGLGNDAPKLLEKN